VDAAGTRPVRDREALSRRAFVLGLLAVLAVAGLLRGLFPAADPPWNPGVGIVWHDEGAWVHNARNKALFGAWSQDAWNPMYIAPVFTGLEYLAFDAFGVGVRQARIVPEVAGLASVWLLALGVARLAGRRAGYQLRVRHVEPHRAHGRTDGRLHGRLLVLLHPGWRGCALGLGRERVRAAGVLYEGVGRVLRRGPGARRGADARAGADPTGR
jgi:hypothetical protein